MSGERTFRDSIRIESPAWMQRGTLERLMYAFTVQLDAMGDALVAGIKLRWPGAYGYESLPLVGRQRQIIRGLQESDESYALRLQHYRKAHQARGGARAMLEQLHAYYGERTWSAQLVYASKRRYTLHPDGSVTQDTSSFGLGLGPPERWAAWALIIPDGLAEYSDDQLRAVPAAWNAAHCLGYVIALPPGAAIVNYHETEQLVNMPSTINTAVAARIIEVS